jgi:peptide/nickel transport system ATP-binding protein
MILRVESLSYKITSRNFFFKAEEKVILNDITFQTERGEIMGIAGESGSGKTTLAKIIAGIIKPQSRSVYFDFKEPESKVNPVQLLFQNNSDIINPYRRVEDTIKETLIKKYGKEELNQRFKKITEELNIPESLLRRRGLELSGGEKQRAALARAIAAGPELLILDEPFSAQDPESQLNLLYLFRKINKDLGITLICISHHTRILRKLCDYFIIMNDGNIVEKGSAEDIFQNPLHPYTRWLISAETYTLTKEQLDKQELLTGSYE